MSRNSFRASSPTTGKEFKPALEKLNLVLDNLLERREHIGEALKRLPPYATALGEVVGSGPGFQINLYGLPPRRSQKCCSTPTSSRASCPTASPTCSRVHLRATDHQAEVAMTAANSPRTAAAGCVMDGSMAVELFMSSVLLLITPELALQLSSTLSVHPAVGRGHGGSRQSIGHKFHQVHTEFRRVCRKRFARSGLSDMREYGRYRLNLLAMAMAVFMCKLLRSVS